MKHNKDYDDLWSAISRIEISVKNSQEDIRKLYLHSVRQEIAIESLNGKVGALNGKVGALSGEVGALGGEVGALNGKVESLNCKVDKHFDQQDKELREFKQETRERFDQLELLIRQLIPNN